LEGNEIGAEGMKHIAEALVVNLTLKELNLCGRIDTNVLFKPLFLFGSQ